MIRIVVEDIAFGKTTIFPEAYSIDVVNTQHCDMLVIAYRDDNVDRVTTYPMSNVYRYTVTAPTKDDEDMNEEAEE